MPRAKYQLILRITEMTSFIEQAEKKEYPVLPLRGTVAFPGVPLSIELERKISVKAFDEAFKNDLPILLLTQKLLTDTEPNEESFYEIGTVCAIKQFVRLSNGNVRLVVSGTARADIVSLIPPKSSGSWYAKCIEKHVYCPDNIRISALRREAEDTLLKYSECTSELSPRFLAEMTDIKDAGVFADFIAANIFGSYGDKMKVLSEADVYERLVLVSVMLREQTEIVKLQKDIHQKVKGRVDKNQREYYISEQMKVLRTELGEDPESDDDIDSYKEKINASGMSESAKTRLLKEASKLARMPINSAEYGVICNYLDICLELPWKTKTRERNDISAAKHVLDRDHDGLDKVKERILEYLAVRQISPELKNQILCLVGPPGTGKTSIVRSVAEALKRKYVRVSLGGVRDEADIRGHRKTYIGSMPGRIIEGMRRAGSANPVMLLDEIDKLTRDSHGDPASALMEVLDSEQNKEFRDHFLELPFDLSDVMFIATANTLDTIPAPLLDRMEIIELKSYSEAEKISILKRHLIPKQFKKHGLSKNTLRISDGALSELINGYTKEAGVRNLERELAGLCRKAAKRLMEEPELGRIDVTVKNIASFMGPRKVIAERISSENEVGVVNGLAYTEAGGALLKVEVAAVPGSGKLELTGSIGDVMKESAKAAVTYIRSHTDEWNIDGNFYKEKDIHIHFPEGAVPKDGPSAGVTMVSALVSELSGRAVKNTVAMTGEVTLRGKVLPIGGLKEKTMAAYKAGVKTVLIPKENERDLADIDKTVRENLEFVTCVTVDDVLRRALV